MSFSFTIVDVLTSTIVKLNSYTNVRTTLTIDPDVAERVKQELSNGEQTLKQVVNERLRIGFGMTRGKTRRPYKVKAHNSPYRPGIDRTKLNQIADEIEAEAVLSKPRSK